MSEHMLFAGVLTPVAGALYPDRSRPGLGLEFKRADGHLTPFERADDEKAHPFAFIVH